MPSTRLRIDNICLESRRLKEAAGVALKDNDISKMHDLIRGWMDALARADRHPQYRLGPFLDVFSSAVEEELHEMVALLVQNDAYVFPSMYGPMRKFLGALKLNHPF